MCMHKWQNTKWHGKYVHNKKGIKKTRFYVESQEDIILKSGFYVKGPEDMILEPYFPMHAWKHQHMIYAFRPDR